MWWKDENGHYVNPAHIISLSVVKSTTNVWKIKADFGDDVTVYLDGTWTSEANAENVIRQLVHGFDPSTL